MTDTKGDRQLPEHVAENRRYWDAMADEWVASGERGWKTDAPSWGCWHIPEADLKLLPDDMSGTRAIELGCGTGYVACWLARRGAEVVGIDNSEKQLATAKRLSDEHDIPITFHHGNAETVPYPDQHFDFAISEYGFQLDAALSGDRLRGARLSRVAGAQRQHRPVRDTRKLGRVLAGRTGLEIETPLAGLAPFEAADSGVPGSRHRRFKAGQGCAFRALFFGFVWLDSENAETHWWVPLPTQRALAARKPSTRAQGLRGDSRGLFAPGYRAAAK